MTEELFCKAAAVVIKCKECEDRRENIQLMVEWQSSSNPVHKKDLIVRLTDDTDPFFLYTLTIGEEDFQSLKTQQGLLVEFSAFPQRFIDLLEQCIREQDKEMPRFLLQLVTSSTVMDRIPANLNVIETNPFKHLTHLSLKLLPANDTDVKKYLAVCLRNMKMERNSLDDRLHRSEEDLNKRLSITQQTLAEKSKELDRLRNEWTSHSSLMSNKHSQEVTTEREKSQQAQRQYQLQWEQQKKEMEIAHSRTVQHLESRLAELETINKDLTERRYKSESSIRELKAKLLGMEEECQRSKQEILSLRRENSTLDAECHEKEKLLNQLRTRTAVLEQEVKDKEQVVTRTTEVFESTQEHKKNLEGSLEQKQQQNRKLEATVKSLSEELLKANEIIKKLQGDMKKLMEKIKLKNTVTMQQEKLIGEKTQTIQKEQMELREVQQSLRLKEEEMSKQQEHLEATVQKLEESKQLLKTNENVISWLNKQLNENKLASMQGTPGSFDPSTISSGNLSRPGVVQNSLQALYSTPFSLPMPHPVSSALASDNYSKIFVPTIRTNTASLIPRVPGRGLQVHFNPMVSNSTSSPVCDSKAVPSTSTPTMTAASTKMESVGLDMKYLQKRDGSNTVLTQGVPLQMASYPSSAVSTRPPVSKPGNPPPRVSAYFPGQQPRLPAS
ncbi:spindle assembly abnormal protein 6 homolog isoform X1 [Callorhinchus milii]|uniref:spindle assembly abnormal protein 6 homolog isoform X1 n=1 Tax=Callorhinchus milii TaxID=7868 RepID=UPI001C3FDED4|nr:spindle assembly abnormal protein 6 homolog isoform X1 [Callorhinchus milii]